MLTYLVPIVTVHLIAHVEASTPSPVILPGIMLPLGTHQLFRLSIPLLPAECSRMATCHPCSPVRGRPHNSLRALQLACPTDGPGCSGRRWRRLLPGSHHSLSAAPVCRKQLSQGEAQSCYMSCPVWPPQNGTVTCCHTIWCPHARPSECSKTAMASRWGQQALLAFMACKQ